MKEKKLSLVPLKYIRIAKNMTIKEIAEVFEVTKACISSIENDQRNIKKQTLIYGLQKLNIKYGDYLELEALSYELSQKNNIDDLKKHRTMLIKAIGVVNPDLKEEAENLLYKYYRKEEEKQQEPVKRKIRLAKGIIIKKHCMK